MPFRPNPHLAQRIKLAAAQKRMSQNKWVIAACEQAILAQLDTKDDTRREYVRGPGPPRMENADLVLSMEGALARVEEIRKKMPPPETHAENCNCLRCSPPR